MSTASKLFFVQVTRLQLLSIFISVIVAATALATLFSAAAGAKTINDIATGDTSACAVVDFKAKCWGNNASGQLGNRSESSATTPVAVDTKASWTETKVAHCRGVSFGPACGGLWILEKKTTYAASPLRGKSVTKVSVGTDHACAIASARVYCWGNNGSGELGNSTTTSSSIPVEVDYRGEWVETIPGYCNGDSNSVTGCGVPTGNWVGERKITHKASALQGKEIVDVSAGDNFSCALASDGTVACWGNGGDGRLGNGDTKDSSHPVAIYTQGAFAGKKGVSLAKASGATMCVVTASTANPNAGTPFCWGRGIDDGRAKPADASTPVSCDKNSPTVKPGTTSKTTIFSSNKPTAVTGAAIAKMDGSDYVTGLAADGKAQYWGQYGYREDVTYTNIKTCRVNPCTGKVTIQREEQDAELAGWRTSSDKTNRPRNSGPVGQRPKVTSQTTTPNKRVTNYSDGGQKVEVRKNNDSTSCNLRTHYGFTKNTVNTTVGKNVTTQPPSWPQAQGGITAQSGDVYDGGLYCAVVAGGARCDAHGGNTKTGQVGNGNNSQVTGPQNVVSNGMLAGKRITQLSTGKTGYTCAVANASVGCWGVNSKGQLGVGDTKHKNVPTEVGL